MIEHVKAQNWIAVGLDFVIVVVGVFIGIQVSNWNEARAEYKEFELARERLRAEAAANLETLDSIDREMHERLSVVRAAFDALRSCVESEDNKALIARGLWRITGTTGVNLRMSALQEITEAPHLSSRLSNPQRKQLADLKYAMTVLKRESNWTEDLPLRERAANNPLVGVGELTSISGTYSGIELAGDRRDIHLNAPVDVACQDNVLIKSFYHWERWQEQVLRYTALQRAMITNTMIALEGGNWVEAP
ncbi:MAG: DUF6090 family protein [Pseudomonadota bacterium]